MPMPNSCDVVILMSMPWFSRFPKLLLDSPYCEETDYGSLCFTAWSFRFLPCWLLAITVSMGFIWLPISGSQPVAIWIFLLLLLSRLFTVFDFMPYHTTPEVEAHILSYQNATYTISPLGLLIWLPHCNGLSKGISTLIWRNLAWSKLKPLQ